MVYQVFNIRQYKSMSLVNSRAIHIMKYNYYAKALVLLDINRKVQVGQEIGSSGFIVT